MSGWTRKVPIVSDAQPDTLPDPQQHCRNTEKPQPEAAEAEIHFRDLAPAIEFVCWIFVVLAPLLRWVNGPAVTNDQFVIQVILVSLALLGAVGLRLYQWYLK